MATLAVYVNKGPSVVIFSVKITDGAGIVSTLDQRLFAPAGADAITTGDVKATVNNFTVGAGWSARLSIFATDDLADAVAHFKLDATTLPASPYTLTANSSDGYVDTETFP